MICFMLSTEKTGFATLILKTYQFRKWRQCSLLCTCNYRSQLYYYMYRRSYTEMSNIRRCLLKEWNISVLSFSIMAIYINVMTRLPSTVLLLTLFVCINASTIFLYIKYCNETRYNSFVRGVAATIKDI